MVSSLVLGNLIFSDMKARELDFILDIMMKYAKSELKTCGKRMEAAIKLKMSNEGDSQVSLVEQRILTNEAVILSKNSEFLDWLVIQLKWSIFPDMKYKYYASRSLKLTHKINTGYEIMFELEPPELTLEKLRINYGGFDIIPLHDKY